MSETDNYRQPDARPHVPNETRTTTPAPQTAMEAAMSVLTTHTMATGKKRTHRMMRRATALKLKREHTRLAELDAIELQCLPVWWIWTWPLRKKVKAREAFNRQQARMYATFLGEVQAGEVG